MDDTCSKSLRTKMATPMVAKMTRAMFDRRYGSRRVVSVTRSTGSFRWMLDKMARCASSPSQLSKSAQSLLVSGSCGAKDFGRRLLGSVGSLSCSAWRDTAAGCSVAPMNSNACSIRRYCACSSSSIVRSAFSIAARRTRSSSTTASTVSVLTRADGSSIEIADASVADASVVRTVLGLEEPRICMGGFSPSSASPARPRSMAAA